MATDVSLKMSRLRWLATGPSQAGHHQVAVCPLSRAFAESEFLGERFAEDIAELHLDLDPRSMWKLTE
ncbi:hypothetical protein ACH474_18820 [Nocardia rhamnosiphila]|uniref:hypothetical protein n=1 Tax=Nocardia rhamnosiphila TaxID=426716 RepID=UPI0037ADEE46